MSAVVIAASRRALAAFVLLIAGLLAVWAATFRVWYVFAPSLAVGKAGGPYLPPAPVPKADCTAGGGLEPCNGVSPAWTIPVALAIGVIGLLVVVLLYRVRRGPAEHRSIEVPGSKPTPSLS
jgi:low affinity Fe/Cu permease